MAKKPTLTTLSSGFNSTTTLNNNFTALRNAFDNTLSLDGSTPNAMNADFDLNGNNILNANSIETEGLTINGVQVGSSELTPTTALFSTEHTGNGSTTTFSMTYNPGVESNTYVFVDGVYQNKSTYSISGTNVIFSEAPPLNSKIELNVFRALTLSETTQASNVGYTATGASALRTVQAKLDEFVSVKDFGAVGDGIANDTAAIQAAIAAIRTNPTSILDTIGGNTITAYSSGVVEFPKGVFKISPDTLLVYQDLGLTLRGQGSRRTNNAVHAPTTILVSGTSSGYGIKASRNGGRGLTIEDLDLCYETSAFTGSVLDVIDCPGVTLNRVFLGTYGITGGTRLQTAAACVRLTYDEFFTANECVFDGAVDGIWFDDARTELGNTFGGSVTAFNQCVFYDFTGDMIRQDGLRTRQGLSINGTVFNPISVNCVRCVDLDNVEGLGMSECVFAGSVANTASTEWMRLSNCTGYVRGSLFNDLSKAGTLSGMLEVSGNRVFATDGFTATGGVISGRSNEFSKGTTGWTFSPTTPIGFDVGPDLFKVGVTRSYDIPADSSNLSGRVCYNSSNDASVSKFRNTSSRVSVSNIDERTITVSSTPYTISINDTGRTILATSGSAQAFTLPAPTPGTKLTVTKIGAGNLTVTCSAGTNYYGRGSTYPTIATLTGAAMGTIQLEAYATVGWLVKAEVGTWSYS